MARASGPSGRGEAGCTDSPGGRYTAAALRLFGRVDRAGRMVPIGRARGPGEGARGGGRGGRQAACCGSGSGAPFSVNLRSSVSKFLSEN